MKKPLLLLLLITSAGAQAQSIGAGTVAVGGNVGYSSSSNKDVISGANAFTRTYEQKAFALALGAHYFVADNLSIGLAVNHVALGGSFTTSPAQVGSNLTPPPHGWQWRVGPTMQYYQLFTEQFGVIGTLGGGYENNRQQVTQLVALPVSTNSPPYYIYTDETAKGYYAGITPAIVFFPVPKFGLTASIGGLEYSHLKKGKPAANVESSSSSFSANFGFDHLLFGGSYYFGR